ncbi:MAG: hypothetical protein F4109_05595 [Gammaproteobacteria bacterium]|nr:hypothetical protein [Gammaproteobacteria bacterium]MYD01140.1 hypothetical protein [Gammaproteobacteria bacterium]MYI24888.1 hypothetical protein [Gammaproteobacteria bacterium]
MDFHEFRNGMTVMDGRRCVAHTKGPMGSGWLLKVHNASWLDPRAGQGAEKFRRAGLRIPRDRSYLLVPSRAEARRILKALARGAIETSC